MELFHISGAEIAVCHSRNIVRNRTDCFLQIDGGRVGRAHKNFKLSMEFTIDGSAKLGLRDGVNQVRNLVCRIFNRIKETVDCVYNICIASLQKRQELMPLKQTNKAEFESKMNSLVDSSYKQIVAVLTPAQKDKMEKLKAAMQGGQGED